QVVPPLHLQGEHAQSKRQKEGPTGDVAVTVTLSLDGESTLADSGERDRRDLQRVARGDAAVGRKLRGDVPVAQGRGLASLLPGASEDRLSLLVLSGPLLIKHEPVAVCGGIRRDRRTDLMHVDAARSPRALLSVD